MSGLSSRTAAAGGAFAARSSQLAALGSAGGAFAARSSQLAARSSQLSARRRVSQRGDRSRVGHELRADRPARRAQLIAPTSDHSQLIAPLLAAPRHAAPRRIGGRQRGNSGAAIRRWFRSLMFIVHAAR